MAGVRSVCIFQAGDDRNWSPILPWEASVQGLLPSGAPAQRWLCKVPGACEGRPAPAPHLRAWVLRLLPVPHLEPGHPRPASRHGPRPPAPQIPGAQSRFLGPPSRAQPPPRPALTLHVVQFGPLLLQFALEALGLALQRRQRLVLMQPVRGHLRAGTRQGRKPTAGMRVSCGRRPGRPQAQLQPQSPPRAPRPPALTRVAANPAAAADPTSPPASPAGTAPPRRPPTLDTQPPRNRTRI